MGAAPEPTYSQNGDFAKDTGVTRIDAILMNTAIAGAKDPVRMARAMKAAVEAGRDAFFSGRIPKKLFATASSPLEGVIGSTQ